MHRTFLVPSLHFAMMRRLQAAFSGLTPMQCRPKRVIIACLPASLVCATEPIEAVGDKSDQSPCLVGSHSAAWVFCSFAEETTGQFETSQINCPCGLWWQGHGWRRVRLHLVRSKLHDYTGTEMPLSNMAAEGCGCGVIKGC